MKEKMEDKQTLLGAKTKIQILTLIMTFVFWVNGAAQVLAVDPILNPSLPNQPAVVPAVEIAPGQTVTLIGQGLTNEPIQTGSGNPLERAQLSISNPVVRGVDLGLVVSLRLRKSRSLGIVDRGNVTVTINGVPETASLRCGNNWCVARVQKPDASGTSTLSFALPNGTRSKVLNIRLNRSTGVVTSGISGGLTPGSPLSPADSDIDNEPGLPQPPCSQCELVQTRTITQSSDGMRVDEYSYRNANDSYNRQVQTRFTRGGQLIAEIVTTPPLAYNVYTGLVDTGAIGYTSNSGVSADGRWGFVTEGPNIHLVDLQTGARRDVNLDSQIVRSQINSGSASPYNSSLNEARTNVMGIESVSPNHIVIRIGVNPARSFNRYGVDVLVYTGNGNFRPVTATLVFRNEIVFGFTQPPITRQMIDERCGSGYQIREGSDPCINQLIEIVRSQRRLEAQYVTWSHPSWGTGNFQQSSAWNIGTPVSSTGYSRYVYVPQYGQVQAYNALGQFSYTTTALTGVAIFDRENGSLQNGIRWFSLSVAAGTQGLWLNGFGSFSRTSAGFFDISEDSAGNVTVRTYDRLSTIFLTGQLPRGVRNPAIETVFVFSLQQSTPYSNDRYLAMTSSSQGTVPIELPTAAGSGSTRIAITG